MYPSERLSLKWLLKTLFSWTDHMFYTDELWTQTLSNARFFSNSATQCPIAASSFTVASILFEYVSALYAFSIFIWCNLVSFASIVYSDTAWKMERGFYQNFFGSFRFSTDDLQDDCMVIRMVANAISDFRLCALTSPSVSGNPVDPSTKTQSPFQ